VTYYFEQLGFRIPVEYSIVDDYLNASVDVKNLDEGDEVYLINVILLPTFGAGNLTEEGYVFVPDGCGAVIPFNMNNRLNSPYEAIVYGRDLAVMQLERPLRQETIRMPVFGTVTDGETLMGVVTEGDAASSILVYNGNSGTGYNSVCTRAMFRLVNRVWSLFREYNGEYTRITQISHTPYALDRYTIRYYPLTGSEAGYSGMARRYRKYLVDEKGLEKNPMPPSMALNVYGNIDRWANFIGFMYDKKVPLTKYGQTMEIIFDLKSRGVENVALRYIGWDDNGALNFKIPAKAKPSGLLGGEKEFEKMLRFFDDEGVAYYLETDPTSYRKSGNGVGWRSDSARSPYKIATDQREYNLATYEQVDIFDPYRLLRPARLFETAKRFAESFGKLDASGVGLGKPGSLMYSDFSDTTGVYRTGTETIFESIFAYYSGMGISIATEGGNAYSVPYSERIFNAPVYSSNYDIFAYDVPFYQMVLHGYVSMTVPEIIQSLQPEMTLLKAAEAGMELLYACIYESSDALLYTRFDNLYSSTVSYWIDQAAERHAEYQKLLRLIYDKTIEKHEYVLDGVALTVYENAVSVLVNYTDETVNYGGRSVGPVDYVWWE
ncbi:MAG: DUF5696 domain-containing protein, partial [Defluviitaleaceae bacterium]|nr:DUF5696 domain-containing protein [Defluviitaleaceae bacterium]